MDKNDLQQQFFKAIKAKLLPHQSMVDELQELLNMSADSAYRRIRGEKPLSIDEAKLLCNAYHISMDQFFAEGRNQTLFQGKFLNKDTFDFGAYLQNIQGLLQHVDSLSDKKIYIDTKDVPPFHYYQFPHLAAFKCYVGMQLMLQYDEQNKILFDHDELILPLLDTGKKIAELYSRIPSVEIWNLESINSTLRQIKFYYECGIIKNKQTVDKLYDELSLLITHIQSQTQRGKKFLYGNANSEHDAAYTVFVNGVFLGDNTMMLETPTETTVFITHGVLNFMSTTDEKFTNHSKNTFNNIMRKSSLISGVNELDRSRFFNNMQQRIVQSKNFETLG